MLKEYLEQSRSSINSTWYDIMTGVTVYRFTTDNKENVSSLKLDFSQDPSLYEVFFCLSGSVLIGQNKGTPINVAAHEILILTDSSSFRSVRIAHPLSGILITIDHEKAKKDFHMLDGLARQMHKNSHNLGEIFKKYQGCFLLHNIEWSRSIFTTLKELPFEHQGDFCIIKIFELLYLLSINSSILEKGIDPVVGDSYLTGVVASMKKYMQEHLDEKLTIDSMCRQYHISATAFKTCFRRLYGQPVHAWILEQRMIHAAYLLCSSPLSILQISQSVGYEGISQFNVIFKRRYGITPRQYRKLSNTGEF